MLSSCVSHWAAYPSLKRLKTSSVESYWPFTSMETLWEGSVPTEARAVKPAGVEGHRLQGPCWR